MITLHGWTDERHTTLLDVRVNPAQICFYRAYSNKGGSRIFFAADALLDVTETPEQIDRLINPKPPL